MALNERINKLTNKLDELDEKHEAATCDIKAIQRKLGEQGQRVVSPKPVVEVKDITAAEREELLKFRAEKLAASMEAARIAQGAHRD